MPLARLSAAFLAIFLANPAFAGVVIEGTDDGETQRFVMEGQKLRIDTGANEEALIFDAAAKRSIQLDPEKKTWSEFTEKDLASMREMMKDRPGPKTVRTTRYEKTGKTDKALGKSCDVYRVVESDAEPGESEEMVCLAKFGTFGVSRDDFAPFRAFGEFASQMTGGELEKSWADLPGIPLIAWEKDEQGQRETFRATKVEKRSVPASEFAVPAGWKKGPSFTEQMREYQRQMDEARKEAEKAGK